MEISGDLLRSVAEVVTLLLLIPLGAYLRNRTYYYSHHPEKIPSIWDLPFWVWDRIQSLRRRNRDRNTNLLNK